MDIPNIPLSGKWDRRQRKVCGRSRRCASTILSTGEDHPRRRTRPSRAGKPASLRGGRPAADSRPSSAGPPLGECGRRLGWGLCETLVLVTARKDCELAVFANFVIGAATHLKRAHPARARLWFAPGPRADWTKRLIRTIARFSGLLHCRPVTAAPPPRNTAGLALVLHYMCVQWCGATQRSHVTWSL